MSCARGAQEAAPPELGRAQWFAAGPPMPKVAIVTDSTADLAPDLVEQRAITVVPLTVMLEGHSYLDGVEIQPDEFYAKLMASGQMATTSQPAPGVFAEV